MSYLDDLKQNQLLMESFYYVPGPDNLASEESVDDIFEGEELSEEEWKNELLDVFTEEELSEVEIDWGTWPDVGRLIFQNKGFTAGQQTGTLKGLAAAALAAAAIAASAKIYKRFFSQSAKACAGKSGADKTNCMNQFKAKAQQAKVKALSQSIAHCSKTKNPTKCKNKIETKLKAEKAKLGA